MKKRAKPVARAEFDALVAEVRVNTELTKDIHAMIRGFKLAGTIAKVIAAVIAAGVAVKTGWSAFRG